MTEKSALPLDGIKVVDLTQVIAGPFATMLMADLGAEVVKIEAPGDGDVSRSWHPKPEYFEALNRNKRSVSLNLKEERGQQLARELVESADVFIENTKPGRIDSFGLGYDDVRAINPEIVYCSLQGFGRDSPYESLPAFDLVIQAMSGVMSMTGESDGPPVWCGLPIADLVTSLYAVVSVTSALSARDRGVIDGEYVEVPMFDSMISLLTARAGHTFGTGEPFPREGRRHPTSAPFGTFETADGKIVVAAGTAGLWPSFCEAIDRPDLVDDDRFATQDDRLENREALVTAIESELTKRPTDEWFDRMRDASVPAGPIHDTKSLWDDEHVQHRGLHRQMTREDGTTADVVANPLRFRSLSTRFESPPPRHGEHTDEICEELGMSPAEVATLREEGVIE